MAEAKKASARWVEGLAFETETGSGHKGVIDGSVKRGPSPMELLLVGVAGCTGIDVVDILKKKREAVTGVEVKVEGVRADTYPMVYTEIDILYIVRGKDVSPKAVEDAIALSEEKYCSASIMMRKTANIKSHYEIIAE